MVLAMVSISTGAISPSLGRPQRTGHSARGLASKMLEVGRLLNQVIGFRVKNSFSITY